MRVRLQENPIKVRPVKSLPAPSTQKEELEKVPSTSTKFAGTPKQKLAVEYFLQNQNQYQAAIKAGYSEAVARCAGENIFNLPNVRAEVNRRLSARFKKEEFNSDSVLMQIDSAANANLLDYGYITEEGEFQVDLRYIDRYQAANIQEFYLDAAGKPKIKLIDKKWAIEKKAQLLRMFDEDQKPTDDSQPLTIQSLDAIVQKVVTNITVNNVTINQQKESQKDSSLVLDAE